MLKRKALLIAVGVGACFAGLTAWVPAMSSLSSNPLVASVQRLGIASVLPGLLAAPAFGGNSHAFSLWGAGIGNFLFYFFLSWGVGQIVMILLKRGER